MGLPLPATAAAQELFNAVAAAGGAKLDHSALLLALERLASHQLGARHLDERWSRPGGRRRGGQVTDSVAGRHTPPEGAGARSRP